MVILFLGLGSPYKENLSACLSMFSAMSSSLSSHVVKDHCLMKECSTDFRAVIIGLLLHLIAFIFAIPAAKLSPQMLFVVALSRVAENFRVR
jgi:hypothetical protein